MTKSEKKTLWVIIGVSIAVGLLLNFGIYFLGRQDADLGGRSSGDSGGGDELVVFDGVESLASIDSYDRGDDTIITDAAHGLVVGDVVMFNTGSAAFGGADAPGFVEATKYYVVTASISTIFEVSATKGGTALDLTAASAGGGEFFTEEFQESGEKEVSAFEHILIDFNTEEGASLTICFLASNMKEAPNWYEAKSTTNRYEHVAVTSVQNNTEIEGDTCVRVDDTDTNEMYFVSLSKGYKWLMPISENFASGSVDVRISGY